jgi:hydroxymethylpyrimidine/phosphomethylpyrimidine kinase
MVATSGDPLLEPDAVAAIRSSLVPLSAVVTPNLDEAELLLGTSIRDVPAMKAAAEALVREHGARAALVKGGHLTGSPAIDVLYCDGRIVEFAHERIDTTSTHGTGCTLSSAMTAELAKGAPLVLAVQAALDFVHRAIRTAPRLGAGHGPLNHFA